MRDLEANRLSDAYLNGEVVLVTNISVVCFMHPVQEQMLWGEERQRYRRLTLEQAWQFAKEHNARFSLFVLELSKRKQNDPTRRTPIL